MGTKYKVDRFHLISYKCKPKKEIASLRCRYIAKSQFVRCIAKGKRFDYINFRGSCLKKVSFDNTTFFGCDFWGVSFKDCSFRNANISDCVFMSCKFTNCDFRGAIFNYSTIVNTNLSDCQGINTTQGVQILLQYPSTKHFDTLDHVLKELEGNQNLRKYKLLHLPGNKFNELNLFLLQQQFSTRTLPELLLNLKAHSTKNITTYKKLELELKKYRKALKSMV